MRGLLVAIAANAAGLAVAAWLLDDIRLGGATTQEQAITLVLLALIFGGVNALVRPVVKVLALPLYVLTLGLIVVVINALMLLLTAEIAAWVDLPFRVDGFWTAVLGALLVSLVGFLVNVVVPGD